MVVFGVVGSVSVADFDLRWFMLITEYFYIYYYDDGDVFVWRVAVIVEEVLGWLMEMFGW